MAILMSDFHLTYKEIMFEIPFNHLIALSSSMNLKKKEKQKEVKPAVIEKEYKNGKFPAFNF